MKRLIAIAAVALLAFTAQAQFLVPSNPPPVISLAWGAVTNASLAHYNLYYGVGSGQYTNKTNVGATNFATVTLPGRGPTYYFAVTDTSTNGLESGFSNEVTDTPATPLPPPPGLQSPLVLTAQWKPSVATPLWASAGMDWTVDPRQANGVFRLMIVKK